MSTPKAKKIDHRRGAFTKHDLSVNYSRVLSQVQTELPRPSRAFSRFIHARLVEKISELLASTLARPNALLFGAIAAFVITLVTYLVAKNFGYRLSGFETIASFVFGWIIGLLYDYVSIMITGKRP